MNTTQEEDPYERVTIYRTAFIDGVVKKVNAAGIRFELGIAKEDIGRTVSSATGTYSEGLEISLYVHTDDIGKYKNIECQMFP